MKQTSTTNDDSLSAVDLMAQALLLANQELASLRHEYDQLRSIVSQLPGITDGSFVLHDANTRLDVPTSPHLTDVTESVQDSASQADVDADAENEDRLFHNAIEFVLEVDKLVWRQERPRDTVLEEQNIRNLLERMTLWERAVRTRYRR